MRIMHGRVAGVWTAAANTGAHDKEEDPDQCGTYPTTENQGPRGLQSPERNHIWWREAVDGFSCTYEFPQPPQGRLRWMCQARAISVLP